MARITLALLLGLFAFTPCIGAGVTEAVEVRMFSWHPDAKGNMQLGRTTQPEKSKVEDVSALAGHDVGGGGALWYEPGRFGLHLGFSRVGHSDTKLLGRDLTIENQPYVANSILKSDIDLQMFGAGLSWMLPETIAPESGIRNGKGYEVRALVGGSSVKWDTKWTGSGVTVSDNFSFNGPSLGVVFRFRERWLYVAGTGVGTLYRGDLDGGGGHAGVVIGGEWKNWAVEAGWNYLWFDVSDSPDSVNIAYRGITLGGRYRF